MMLKERFIQGIFLKGIDPYDRIKHTFKVSYVKSYTLMNQKFSKVRDSNFELLRIVAISMVLILHADFFSLEGPSAADIMSDLSGSSMRILIQALTISAVDIFVMISGYYGIQHSKHGIFNFLFQTFFYLIIIYVVCIACGLSKLNMTGIKELFMLTSSNWFLKSYILLYIIAPVLNAFVSKANKRQFKFILISYYAFILIWGWLFPTSTDYIAGGYSPLFFVWLYLLARYMRLYSFRLTQLTFVTAIIFYSITAFFVLLICISTYYIGGDAVYGYILLQYISPTTVATAMLLIIATSKLHISSKLINRLAASSFAVYLVCVNPNLLTPYRNLFSDLYHTYSDLMYWLIVLGLVAIIYIAIAVIDTIRIFLWKRIELTV